LKMELKRRVRQAIELAVFVSALPVLLLGCGGGGGGTTSSDPNAGRMSGQFWTEVEGAGLRIFYAGFSPSSPARGYLMTAMFGGGKYTINQNEHQLRSTGWQAADNSYSLTASGWLPEPTSRVATATDATHFSGGETGLWNYSTVISTIDLSGMPIVASSAVLAVTSMGYISAVAPASAVYPAGSYEFDLTSTYTQTDVGYGLNAQSQWAVTTKAGTATPISQANFSDAGFAAHASISDPICFLNYGLVHTTGTTYEVYWLVPDAPLSVDEWPDCLNSSIPGTAVPVGTMDMSIVMVNGTPIIRFTGGTNSFASNPYANFLIGYLPSRNTAYWGWVSSAGSGVSTSYTLNKTAMDAALTAWGVPTF
jgi:hypothetical protein